MKKSEYKLTLDSREWREFFFEDVINIKSGVRLTKADMTEGKRPFIGASDSNNGITFFTDSVNNSLDSNVLGVNYNGSVGFSFYHPYEAVFSDDVKRVRWIDEKRNNPYTLLFLSSLIHQQKDKYAYGYKFNGQRMKRQKILVPVCDNDASTPDWDFMEAYMKQTEQEILKPTIEKLCKQLIISNIGGGKTLHPRWQKFAFGDNFCIEATQSGIDKNKLSGAKGNVPYITRTDTTNGIGDFVGSEQGKWKCDRGNVITIGLDTQTVFYQPSPFYTGQNIQVISHPQLNRHNALFLIVAIKKLVDKFAWGSYGATLTRLRKSFLYLPATESGEIDFAFMTQFMQEVEHDILGTTLKYLRERQSVNECKTGGGKSDVANL